MKVADAFKVAANAACGAVAGGVISASAYVFVAVPVVGAGMGPGALGLFLFTPLFLLPGAALGGYFGFRVGRRAYGKPKAAAPI